MKKHLLWLSLMSFFCFSCDKCNEGDCNCFVKTETGIVFLPETDPKKQGFIESEIDTIYIDKLNKGTQELIFTDTLILVPEKSRITESSLTTYFWYERKWDKRTFDAIYINSENPHRNGEYFSQFDYKIRIGEFKEYLIAEMEIENQIQDEDCCKCLKNIKKTLLVNGELKNFSGDNSPNALVRLKK